MTRQGSATIYGDAQALTQRSRHRHAPFRTNRGWFSRPAREKRPPAA